MDYHLTARGCCGGEGKEARRLECDRRQRTCLTGLRALVELKKEIKMLQLMNRNAPEARTNSS